MLVRHKRLTASQLSNYTGQEGQLVVNKDHHTLAVMDGVTPGGFTVSGQVTLQGPVKLKADEPNIYTITNWSKFSEYEITAQGAEVELEGDTLTITPPPESIGVELSISCDGVVRDLEIPLDGGVFSDTHDEMSKGPLGRLLHSAAVTNGRMYVVGSLSTTANRSLWDYNPSIDEWSEHPNVPVAIGRRAMASVGNKLYLLGLSTIYVYDTETNVWSTQSDISSPVRFFLTVETLADKIYILGGSTTTSQNTATVDCWVYDPNENILEPITPLPEPRTCHSSFTIGNKIYLFGGYNGSGVETNSLLVYDVDLDSWTNIPVPTHIPAKVDHTAVSVGSKGYIFGGNTQGVSTHTNDLWEYDPFEDVWRELSVGITARRYHSMVELDGAIYIFGGQGPGNVTLDDLWRIKGRALFPLRDLTYLTSDDYPARSIVYNWQSGESDLYSLTNAYTTGEFPIPVHLHNWSTVEE